MGYNARNDEIRDNVHTWEAQRGALTTVRRFNAILSSLVDYQLRGCGTVIDLDSSVKPRDPEASIRVALRDVQCPRCNGHGRPHIIALARHPSI
jgi:hypothetical protein